VTSPAGLGPGVARQLGFGQSPDLEAWTWMDMTYSEDNGARDVFSGQWTPLDIGVYSYTVRFGGNSGPGNPNQDWYYGDLEGNSPDGAPFDVSRAGRLIVRGVSDLGLVQETSLESLVAQETVVYTLTVSNSGPQPATYLVATSALPAGAAFASASPGCNEDGGIVTCQAAGLQVGAQAVFSLTASLNQLGPATSLSEYRTMRGQAFIEENLHRCLHLCESLPHNHYPNESRNVL